MINVAVLTGRLTAKPELNETSSGIPYVRFCIAVQRKFKHEETDFINIVAWQHTAKFICNNFDKGNMIGIEGHIRTEKYVESESGKNRTSFDVVADNVRFTEKKRSDIQASELVELTEADGDLPF